MEMPRNLGKIMDGKMEKGAKRRWRKRVRG
jgi:hypothetical protein